MVTGANIGRLAGRLAMVTGGGSGIGQAVCCAFAREGARVAVVDLNEKGLQETLATLGDGHHSFVGNISKSAEVQTLMKDVTSTFSAVPTIAVNCAGITRDNFLLKMDEKSFDEVININLKGSYLLTQAVARGMVEANINNGSIILISSIVGKVGNIGQGNYAASKAGVLGLTKTAAREFARYGIRCNAVLPGFITTPMTAVIPEKVLMGNLSLIPQGRLGKPEEVASSCVFLASDESSYITGTCLEVTGGLGM